jgi:hypothetical protein
MPSGFVTLGQIATHLAVLDVACDRWGHRWPLRDDRLMSEHCAALPVPELPHILTADFPWMQATRLHDVCRVRFPGVVG